MNTGANARAIARAEGRTGSRRALRVLISGALAGLLLASSACSRPWDKTLPASTELGQPRGYLISRTILHLHSPYSHDACDSQGTSNGTPNAACLAHLRAALCSNRIDAAFLTDHPNNMVNYDFTSLLLNQSGDEIVTQSSLPVASKLGGCDNGTSTLVTVGFEDRLMPLGMTQHLAGTASQHSSEYIQEDAAFVTRLKSEADAIVIVPHTESRADTLLSSLGMDGIEIYNFHANLDPKIRHDWLGLDYYEGSINLLPYWIDPYGQEQPDLALISFFQIAPVYASKWNRLIAAGLKPVGTGGSDAHENVIKSTTRDGERVDSYRRMLRWMSNHYLVPDRSYASIKAAIRAGRGWLVFEGFGSPVGMDYYATAGGTTIGVGETGTFVAGSTTIHVSLPSLHRSSPRGWRTPHVRIRLLKVQADATTAVVAETLDSALDKAVDSTGAYRAEIAIQPLHLSEFLDYDRDKAEQEMPWIITNHIYLQ